MFTFKKSAMKIKNSEGVMEDSGVLFGSSETDSTLTKSGVAADAATVGEKLTELAEESSHTFDEIILNSSTDGSTKKFRITVNDNGSLTSTEITE